jgi:hypothetical protein
LSNQAQELQRRLLAAVESLAPPASQQVSSHPRSREQGDGYYPQNQFLS